MASPSGTQLLVVDSGAMVNLLGAAHSARLKNQRAPDPSIVLYAAGDNLLNPVLQGDMQLILTNNSAMVALQTMKTINASMTKTQSEISTGKSVATAHAGSAPLTRATSITKARSTARSSHAAPDSSKGCIPASLIHCSSHRDLALPQMR